ncbi:MAG: tetratricopeptide repeat protein [Limisphaerales bacterium]
MSTSPRKQSAVSHDRHWLFQRGDLLVMAVLVFVTVALYWPIRQHEFINYDDPDYITANPMVQQGFTWEGVRWAFTSSHSYNWHPITWLSHMMDVQFFGMNPGAHHLVSLLFHISNALLLFWVLRRITATTWPAAIVAAVFAWHPLHVESVAWACERKDVLSTFFWLLTTLFYVRYAAGFTGKEARSKIDYPMALGCFALGLMSKPMLVTLPFTLLLLDLWPLRRCSVANIRWPIFGAKSETESSRSNSEHWSRLLLEKVPFFLLTIGSSIITFLVQRTEGAVVKFEHLPLADRLANAVVSYVRYIGKSIWPADLIVYYQPVTWSALQVGIALGLIVGFSIGALWLLRKQPYVFVGWFWFIGTLVPVIGIVQVGAQAMADRYMYVPLIGLSIAVVWPIAEAIRANKRLQPIFAVATVAGLVAFCVASAKQVRHWRSSETIFTHVVNVDPKNVVARVMLANALLEGGRFEEAEKEFAAALAINPNFPEVHFNLGNLYVHQKRIPEAIRQYEAALARNPSYSEAHANLAVALGMVNRLEEAIMHYQASLALQPNQPDTMRNLAMDLMTLRRFEEANASLQRVLQLDPGDALSHFLMGNLQMTQGRANDAAQWYTRALQLKPDFTEAQQRLAQLQTSR